MRPAASERTSLRAEQSAQKRAEKITKRVFASHRTIGAKSPSGSRIGQFYYARSSTDVRAEQPLGERERETRFIPSPDVGEELPDERRVSHTSGEEFYECTSTINAS